MRFTEETMKKINAEYAQRMMYRKSDLAVSDDKVRNGIMCFCNVDEISKMISELTEMRDVIKEITGVIV